MTALGLILAMVVVVYWHRPEKLGRDIAIAIDSYYKSKYAIDRNIDPRDMK